MSDRVVESKERRGIPFVTWASLWLVGGVFGFVLVVKDLIGTGISYRLGRDFANLWIAGKLALDGRGYWAFDLDTFRLGFLEYLKMPTSLQIARPVCGHSVRPAALLCFPGAVERAQRRVVRVGGETVFAAWLSAIACGIDSSRLHESLERQFWSAARCPLAAVLPLV